MNEPADHLEEHGQPARGAAAGSEASGARACHFCGSPLPPRARFCPQCGKRLVQSSVADRFRPEMDDDEEQILWQGRYSAKAMIGHWTIATLATIAALVAIAWLPRNYWWLPLLGAAVLWGILLMLLAYRKIDQAFTLTNQRFIHKEGILTRYSRRIEVIDIDDVTYRQGILERLVGVGTIVIESSDRSDPALVVHGIDDVAEVAQMIDEGRRAERIRRGLHIEAV